MSPTDSTDRHRTYCSGRGSHRFHGFSQNLLLRIFSHRFHGCKLQGVHLSPLGFAACQSKKCTNVARGISTLLGWCTSCSGKRQSRAETSAPPEVSSICADPCNPWENIRSKSVFVLFVFVIIISVIVCCGGRRPPLRMGAHPNNLCRSVQSVGEYSNASK